MPVFPIDFSVFQSLITFREGKNINIAVSMYFTLNLSSPNCFANDFVKDFSIICSDVAY